jgi:CRISPR/Cas system CMR-associated protein Cmr5 small subunit
MKAKQWEKAGPGYTPCNETTKGLPSGVYSIETNPMGLFFVPRELKTDNLLRFEDPTHTEIISEIDTFWSLKEKYTNMGFLHNRAILMHGPPGSGKSCISKIVVSDVVQRDNIVINCDNLYVLSNALRALRDVEPNRQTLVLMEDIDSIDGQHRLLPLLDGEDTADNIMYLCTTNYIDRLSERILRPGRIDRKINVAHPPRAGRVAFFESKLGTDAQEINSLADATRGLSFAHLRELLVGVYCLGQNPEKVIERLRKKGPEILTPIEERMKDRKIHAAVKNRTKRKKAVAAVKTLKSAPFKLTADEKLFILRRRNDV